VAEDTTGGIGQTDDIQEQINQACRLKIEPLYPNLIQKLHYYLSVNQPDRF
jgi:hypothetical protein